MFGIFNKKSAANFEKDVKKFNTSSAVTVAAHKVAHIGFGTAGAATTVVAGNCYYASQKKHMSRKQRKQGQKINQMATGVAIIGAGIGSVATVIEAVAQPLPFDQSKYLFDDDIDGQVAEAEEVVDAKIAPEDTEETQEGAEQNAQ